MRHRHHVIAAAIAVLTIFGAGTSAAAAQRAEAAAVPEVLTAPAPLVRATVPRAGTTTTTTVSYGTTSQQVATVTRPTAAGRYKTLIFAHGGYWVSGTRNDPSVLRMVNAWAADGWVVVNLDYRLGNYNQQPDDGKAMLADITAAVTKWRSESYVDPKRVVLGGDSAGGHLTSTVAAQLGKTKVAGAVLWSPVVSPPNAAADGQQPDASTNMRNLGLRAAEFFGYSSGVTTPLRYVDQGKAPAMFVVASADEWLTWGRQAAVLCGRTLFTGVCHEIPGQDHGSVLRDAQPAVAADSITWADLQRAVTAP